VIEKAKPTTEARKHGENQNRNNTGVPLPHGDRQKNETKPLKHCIGLLDARIAHMTVLPLRQSLVWLNADCCRNFMYPLLSFNCRLEEIQ
jgi:hypothetical protein